MNNSLRQDFVKRTLATLENLAGQLGGSDAGNFSEAFRREAFRSLHTIKGTAQTIGFTASARLAHELENLLAAAGVKSKKPDAVSPEENCKTLFAEGLENLKKTFEDADFEIPEAVLNRIGERVSASESNRIQTNLSEIPDKLSAQLTKAEKTALGAALQNGKKIFCLEVKFDMSNFGDGFAAFRQTLCDKCEIIATLPAGSKQGAAAETGEIGFQILIATNDDIAEMLEKNRARIVFQYLPEESSSRLKSVVTETAAHGEKLAKQLGKQIRFEINVEETVEVAPEFLKNLFDVLTHLIRNAVDHAIEAPEERSERNKTPSATIKIDFSARETNLLVRVADDGRGIDGEWIKAKAVEKKLVASGANFGEMDALALIFLPEFSTREAATEISGRGVGLDAVKNIIEQSGGTIGVESEIGRGTIFEIILPHETENQ